MEVWAAVDLMKGEVVRLVKGIPETSRMYSRSPVATAERWEEEGADGLHIVDLDAALEGGDNLATISEIVRRVEIPVQVGGGIRSVGYGERLLSEGVYRIVVGTMAFTDREGLSVLLERYGDERVMVSLDYESGEVKIRGWREATGMGVEAALRSLLDSGVKYFLLTAIERDGTLRGPDLPTLKRLSGLQGARIFASGGVGRLEDMAAFKEAGVYGVVVGRALYEGAFSLREAVHLIKEGV